MLSQRIGPKDSGGTRCSLSRPAAVLFEPDQAQVLFRTSGTTGRRGIHRLLNTELYDLGPSGTRIRGGRVPKNWIVVGVPCT